jgi:hypothetical protein
MAEKRSPDDAAQSKRFEETAREVGADESGKLFQRAFRKVVVPAKKKRRPKPDA